MAVSRYLNNDTKKSADGKTVYKSKRLKRIINITAHLLTGGLLLMLTTYTMVSSD